MKKRIITATLIASFTFLLTGCGGSKTFTVELPGNESTGYEWTYTESATGVVKEINKTYKASEEKEKEGQPGTGGTYLFEFESVKPGKVALEFQYARSWETDKGPINRKKVSLEVNEKGNITEEETKK